jgi:lactoylglutathione lyase
MAMKDASMSSDISAVDFETRRWIWGTDVTEPRLLHIAIRVRDIEPALRFYVDGLGMKLIDRINIGPRRVTVVFVGYNEYSDGALVELARYWDDDVPYTHGTGFGHISIGVPNVVATFAKLEALGAEISVRPTDYLGRGPHIAYVKDPDGYTVELIQTCKG